jgi:hypothetical protein
MSSMMSWNAKPVGELEVLIARCVMGQVKLNGLMVTQRNAQTVWEAGKRNALSVTEQEKPNVTSMGYHQM